MFHFSICFFLFILKKFKFHDYYNDDYDDDIDDDGENNLARPFYLNIAFVYDLCIFEYCKARAGKFVDELLIQNIFFILG